MWLSNRHVVLFPMLPNVQHGLSQFYSGAQWDGSMAQKRTYGGDTFMMEIPIPELPLLRHCLIWGASSASRRCIPLNKHIFLPFKVEISNPSPTSLSRLRRVAV